MSDIIEYKDLLDKYLTALNDLDRACDVAAHQGNLLGKSQRMNSLVTGNHIRMSVALRDHTVMKRVISNLIRRTKMTMRSINDLDSNKKVEPNGQR